MRARHNPRTSCQATGQAAPAGASEPNVVRGVRLKVVSYFTLAFAVLCTLAFIAGYTTR